MNLAELRTAVRGDVVSHADGSYASARDALIWNDRKPGARPLAIVRPVTVADVQETIRFAAKTGLTVSPRGTGHNFSGIAAQDGIVLDLGAFDDVRIDAATMTAEVGPAATNGHMAELLTASGLAFPLGHCASVGLGGYLLGGGFGWNTGEWGPACHSVESADVVLADGRLVTASANENPELYWAVRGAGPMFFGAVVRYRLRLQKLRPGMMAVARLYPLDRIDEISRWMQGTMAVAARGVEFTTLMQSAPPPLADRTAKVATALATVFAETEADAVEALEGVALWAPADPLEVIGPMPVDYATLYGLTGKETPEGARYLADAAWTDDPHETFRRMAAAIAEAPSPLSHAIANLLPARSSAFRPLAPASFSMAGSAFGALMGVWTDPAEDAANTAWLRAAADTIAPTVKGYYVGEADLVRPERLQACYGSEAWERLKVLRANYDPTGRFRRRTPFAAHALTVAAE